MKPKDQEFYLIAVEDYSPSGFAIAQYRDGVYYCDATDNDLTDYSPTPIKHLI